MYVVIKTSLNNFLFLSPESIFLKTSNTMTDRCTVNQKITKQLFEKQKKLSACVHPLNAFYCGVHPLDSFAMAMDNTEKRVKSDSFKNPDISQTHSFINVVFKVFHRKDGAGGLAEIKAFLKFKKMWKTLSFIM